MAYSQQFLEKHRNINVDYEWWGSTYDDFSQICTILGIELDKDGISFSGFWSQGDGASWTGRYRANGLSLTMPSGYVATYDLAPAKIREHAPQDEELHRIADELCMLGRIYYPAYARVTRCSHNYAHENTMNVDHTEPYDEFDDAEEFADEVTGALEAALQELFRDLARWLYKSLEAEYDHLTGDEAVAETLEANEIVEEEEEEEEEEA